MEQIYNSEICSATVFLKGAEIERKAQVHLNVGENKITFAPLSENILPDSIIASADIGQIISVRFDKTNLVTAENSEKIKGLVIERNILQDEIDILNDEIDILNDEIEVYELQLNMLSANCNSGGHKRSLDEIKNLANYYIQQNTFIKQKLSALKKQIKDKNIKLEILNNEIGSSDVHETPTGILTIIITSEEDTITNLNITYVNTEAGWTPFYNLRVTDSDKPIILHAKAVVWQTTGENWNDLPITLSSSNMQSGKVIPVLSPLVLGKRDELYPFNLAKVDEDCFIEDNMDSEENMKNYDTPCMKAPSLVVDITENQTAIEFKLPTKCTIISGENNILDIITHTINAEFTYYSVPKLEGEVYLIARISEWDKFNILAGKCNIFLSGVYIGQTNINPYLTNDNIEIFLGQDNSVIVSRIKSKDKSSKALFGNIVKNTFEWEITIKNTKSNSIFLELIDQIPIAFNDSIKVDIIDISDAILTKNTGELRWKLELKSGDVITKQVCYIVSYPKNMSILLDNLK